MPLSSSRFNKVVGSDRIEIEDIKAQEGLLAETFKEVRGSIDNDFIDSIHERWVINRKLSDKQIQGLLNFHNKLVKD